MQGRVGFDTGVENAFKSAKIAQRLLALIKMFIKILNTFYSRPIWWISLRRLGVPLCASSTPHYTLSTLLGVGLEICMYLSFCLKPNISVICQTLHLFNLGFSLVTFRSGTLYTLDYFLHFLDPIPHTSLTHSALERCMRIC